MCSYVRVYRWETDKRATIFTLVLRQNHRKTREKNGAKVAQTPGLTLTQKEEFGARQPIGATTIELLLSLYWAEGHIQKLDAHLNSAVHTNNFQKFGL